MRNEYFWSTELRKIIDRVTISIDEVTNDSHIFW